MKKSEIKKELGIDLRKEQFLEKVMNYANREGLRYSEAIIEVCEEYGVEPEDVIDFIGKPLKEKLRVEAMKNNIIPNTIGNTLAGV